MFFHIDAASGIPIYIQVINQVKNCIAGGMLVSGDRLPSVRELANQLVINPNTIQKAYQELERDGIIKTKRGSGTFVCGGSNVISDIKRKENLKNAIQVLLTETYHLNYTKEEFLDIFNDMLKNWASFRGGEENG